MGEIDEKSPLKIEKYCTHEVNNPKFEGKKGSAIFSPVDLKEFREQNIKDLKLRLKK